MVVDESSPLTSVQVHRVDDARVRPTKRPLVLAARVVDGATKVVAAMRVVDARRSGFRTAPGWRVNAVVVRGVLIVAVIKI